LASFLIWSPSSQALAGVADGRTPGMYDHSLFLRTLSEFSAKLLSPYDVDAVLRDLMERLTDVLGLAGSGVALAREGRLEFTTAVPDQIAELERAQIEHQSGPCVDAYLSGRVVTVTDLQSQRDHWPEYCVVAERVGVSAVAGIPMRLSGEAFGAINLYVLGPRPWPEDDIAAAVVMADMATNYLVNASKLRQQEQLNEQLQKALDSRAIIEQAKGIVARERQTTTDQAFKLIRTHARNHNVSIRSVAEAIVRLGLQI
jgi:GAF domain-containing protein